ncbi:pilin, partial [Patescibacteria group bacterium]|nr:pilin [Patescibacteria group bacterium]MBU1783164.1 pilin [Patescibacteria group bacterium]
MIKKFTKSLVGLAMSLLIVLPLFAFTSITQAVPLTEQNLWGGTDTAITPDTLSGTMGLGTADPRTMAAKIINVAMGFLGIIAVVIILIGGFKWMTAGGGEEKVEEATKMIKYGVIGLIIILAS